MLTAQNAGKRDVGLAGFSAQLRLHTGTAVTVSGFQLTDMASGEANRTVVNPDVAVPAASFVRWHMSSLMVLSPSDVEAFTKWLDPTTHRGLQAIVKSQLESVRVTKSLMASYTPISAITVTAVGGDRRLYWAPDFMTRVLAALEMPDDAAEVWYVPSAAEAFVVRPTDFHMPGFQSPK